MTTHNPGEKPITRVLAELIQRMASHSETATLDAQVLLAHILHAPRSWVLAHPEHLIPRDTLLQLESLASRLEKGEPLPYILGHQEFFGLEFDVTPDVLIPRPESELLVEHAVAWLQAHPKKRTAADIGTGSGCLAVTLSVHIPDLHVTATDISAAALDVARGNAKKHRVQDRVHFIEEDLFPSEKAGEKFHLIVANLPYIPSQELRRLPVYKSEPTLALDGGMDGLSVIQRFLSFAPQHLDMDGLLLMEIEASQGVEALSLAHEAFPNGVIQLYQDLAGLDRMLEVHTGEFREWGP